MALVFTDLVGSTELAVALGPAEADSLRREHFALLRRAMAGTGGREVKNLGDGLMLAFASVAGAVRCAVRMQQAIERHNRRGGRPLTIRVAISVGDATAEEGDYFGAPVVEAARLCDAAEGGTILASEAVRLLAGDRVRVARAGELRLKGLPEPVGTWRIAWEPLSDGPGAFPLPARLSTVPPTSFIGRADVRARLRENWAAARAGGWQATLVTGEPGIGKTRIATYLAVDARAEGGAVLYGRCDEEVRAPFQPWLEAFGHLAAHAPEEILAAHAERHGGALTRLAPGLRERLPELTDPPPTDPETERWLLFAAAADLVARMAREQPLLVVLDDLHWADRASLGLLRHMASVGRADHVLVVGTFRPGDLGRSHPLTALLAELRREPGVERVDLGGLTEPEVVSLVEAVAGHELDDPSLTLAAALHRETDGNPFFVGELLRHLSESGRLDRSRGRWHVTDAAVTGTDMPQSVRDVIGGRVERLGETALRALQTAAVIGREFDVRVLAAATGEPEDELLDVLDAACDASIVAEAGEDLGHYAFVHALFPHTLYADLTGARRARLHRRVAEALETAAGDDPGPVLEALAFHWSQATRTAEPERAIHFARLAGERALGELAPDAAVGWFRQALELEEEGGEHDRALRCDLLTGLGEAQRQSGDPDFRETLLEAGEIARTLGDGDRTAHAALVNTRGYFSAAGLVDDERVAVLEAAAELLPERDVRRARVLALLATELQWDGDLERRRAMTAEAIALVRELGDDADLAHVEVLAMTGDWGPDNLGERLARTRELITLAARLNDPVISFWAVVWHGVMSAHAGDLEEADRCLARQRALVARLGQPGLRYVHETQVAWRTQIGGTVDEGEDAASAALQTGADAGEPDVMSLFFPQLLVARRAQCRLEEVVDLLRDISESLPAVSQFRAMCAIAEYDLGRVDTAAAMLDDAGADGFRGIPRDTVWLNGMIHWAELAARLGAREHAAHLRELLEPVTQVVPLEAIAAFPVLDHYRGLLDAALGEDEHAELRLRAALTLEEQLGARGFAARTRLELGRLELTRGASREGTAAIEQAAAEAAAIGIVSVEREAQAMLAALQAGGPPD